MDHRNQLIRKRARVLAAGLAVALLIVGGGMASYHHARVVADDFVGTLPPGTTPYRAAPIPFHPAPGTKRWSWEIAYGDQFHDGFEVYVNLIGKIVGTNPPDLRAHLSKPLRD